MHFFTESSLIRPKPFLFFAKLQKIPNNLTIHLHMKKLLLLFWIVFACKSSTTIPKEWKKVDTDFFSFYAPKILQNTDYPYNEQMKGISKIITCSDSSLNVIVRIVELQKLYIDTDSPTVLDAAFGGILKGFEKTFWEVKFTGGKYFDVPNYKVREHTFTSKSESGKTIYHKVRIYMNVGNIFIFLTLYSEDKKDKVEDLIEPFFDSIKFKK
jgi:hypothetical protein